MSELTREKIEQVRTGFPHSEALNQICDYARRTLDAKQRAEQAEADAHEQRIHYDNLFDEAEKIRHQRDEERQEAVNLREALQHILSIGERHTDSATGRRLGDFHEALQVARESLRSSDAPASEPEKCPECDGTGAVYCGEWAGPCPTCRYDQLPAGPAPADRPEPDAGRCEICGLTPKENGGCCQLDRPEPSEVLERALEIIESELDNAGVLAELPGYGDAVEYVREHLSQTAPAVPEIKVRNVIRQLRNAAEDEERTNPNMADNYTYFANELERALAHPSDSPAVPDGYALVPKEPTHEMLHAAAQSPGSAIDCLRAAIAAAPTPTDGEHDE